LKYKLIIEKLKSERIKQGFTQKEIAKKALITNKHLCNIERFKASPSFEVIVRIAEALDCEVDVQNEEWFQLQEGERLNERVNTH